MGICLEYYSYYIVIHILVGAIAASVLGLIIWLVSNNRLGSKVKQIWHTLTSKKTKNVFTQEMVVDLDEPVQRYFLHVIAPGTLLATSVELEISGNCRLKPDTGWKPTATSAIISISSDIIEKAKLGKGLRKFSFLSLISLVNAQNDNINCSDIGELAIESICLPSALLPHNGVTWQTIADNTIQANFKIDNEPIAMTLTIDSEGKLLKMSVQHGGNPTEKGDWHNIPFGGEIQAEKTFGGYTIPTKIIAGWWFGTSNYWEFFQLSIEQAKFS